MFDDPYDDDEEEMPDWVDEGKLEALVTEVAKRLEHCGVYIDPSIAIEVADDHLHVYAMAKVGDLAFSKRVQNPEQDNFDQAFHRLELDHLHDRVEEIKDKFRGKKKPEQP